MGVAWPPAGSLPFHSSLPVGAGAAGGYENQVARNIDRQLHPYVSRAGASGASRPPSLEGWVCRVTRDGVPDPAQLSGVRQRRVRCTRIGKHVRFRLEHLEELVTAGEQPVASPALSAVSQLSRDRRRSSL